MKRFCAAFILIALLGILPLSALARDGFEYSNWVGDPEDTSSYSPGYDEGYYLPVCRVAVANTENGPSFSLNRALLVVGQSFIVSSYKGLKDNYTFSGDSNFAKILKNDGVLKNTCFSGEAVKTGLSQAVITDKQGKVISTLGIEVVNPYIAGNQDNGSSVSIPLYSWVIVRLDANPTTGYDWQVVSQGSNINIASSGYMQNPDNSRLTGAPSKKYFLLQGTAPGKAQLQLQYCRPWDSSDVVGTYAVTINVSENE